MAQVNEHYQKLRAGYLFPEIKRRTEAFQEERPDAAVIKLGIGDVTLPLAPAVLDALHRAVDEMGTAEGFRAFLEGLAEYGWTPVTEAGNPIALKRDGAAITLEPAGQVELSGGVKKTIFETRDELERLLQDPKVPCLLLADLDGTLDHLPRPSYPVEHLLVVGQGDLSAPRDLGDLGDGQPLSPDGDGHVSLPPARSTI